MMKQRIISILLTACMIVSLLPFGVFAAEEATPNVLIGESFDDCITGSVPDDVFRVKRVGGDMAVVESDSSGNKNLMMKCEPTGTVYIEKDVTNPEKAPLLLSFRLKLLNSGSFSLVNVVEADGSLKPVFNVKDGSLVNGEEVLKAFDTNTWYYVEIIFNLADKAYSVSVNNEKLIKKINNAYFELPTIRFQLTQTEQSLCIDDIGLFRADVVSDDREYFPGSPLYLDNILQMEAEDIASKGILMYNNSTRSLVDSKSVTISAAPVELEKVMYLPIRFVIETLGGEVGWDSENNWAIVSYGDKKCRISDNLNKICTGDNAYLPLHPVKKLNNSLYMSVDDAVKLYNIDIMTDIGFIMINGEKELYSAASDLVRNEVKSIIKYERYNADELYSMLVNRFPDNAHPRIQGNLQRFEEIKATIASDDLAGKMYSYLKNYADSQLEQPVMKWVEAPGTTVNDLESRIKILAFVYRITGDAKYADRCLNEMKNVCSWHTWYGAPTTTPLSCAYVLRGMAYGYDWLYDYMTEEQRVEVAQNIKEKALDPYMDAFVGNIQSTKNGDWAFWIDDPLNFNPHNNSAIIAASVTLAERYPEFCADIMSYAIRSLETHFSVYEPDGAWIEGPDYGYVVLNSGVSVINCLENAFGSHMGFATVPGLKEAAYYYQYILGPTGFFNFSDAGKQTRPEYAFSFALAKYLNDVKLGYFRKTGLEESEYVTRPDEMFYYDPSLVGNDAGDMAFDDYFRGVETATMRSSWDDNAIFAGIHSGYNYEEHGHLDMGTFVIDANGEEWICDHRYDPYRYSSMTYTTYRTRAEGHSTLVIDDTPYSFAASGEDGGYLNYKTYDFQDDTIDEIMLTGDRGDGLVIQKSGVSNAIIKQDNENFENKYMLLEGSMDENAKGWSYYQLNFPEPITTGAELSFKVKYDSFASYSDTSNHNGKQIETGSSLGSSTSAGFYFPLRITSAGKLSAMTLAGDQLLLDKLKTNVWYEFRVKYDIENNKFSVSADGGSDGGAAALNDLTPTSNIPDLKYLCFRATTNICVDDINLKIHPDELDMALETARRYDQERIANGYIDKFESKTRGAFAITDITEAYPEQAESAVRGISLCEERSAVVVRDEVKLKKKSDIYWFAQMKAKINVDVAEDGRSAIMEQNGKKMWVGILSKGDYKIEMMDATPLPGAPDPEEQLANTDIKRMAIVARGVTDMNLSVAFIPLNEGQSVPNEIPDELPLEMWSVPEGELPEVSSITVNGEPIADFVPDRTYYTITLYDDNTTIPRIDATTDNGTKITVTQAATLPGSAVVTAEKNGTVRRYYININHKILARGIICGQEVTELDITTSGYTTDSDGPFSILDGDITTRWVGPDRGQWIAVDLNSVIDISSLQIAWMLGDERNYSFSIEVSNDGTSWETAFEGYSSGKSEDLETFTFDKTYKARYIKVVCNGHAGGQYSQISEIK